MSEQLVTEEEYLLYIRSFDPWEAPRGYEPYGSLQGPAFDEKLRGERLGFLRSYYDKVYRGLVQFVDSDVITYASFQIGGEIITSLRSRTEGRSFVYTSWLCERSGELEVRCYPGQVEFFFAHHVSVDEKSRVHNFAFVRHFKPFGQPVYSTSPLLTTSFEGLWNKANLESVDCIVPVQRLICQFVPVFLHNSVDIFTACPLQRRIHF